MSRWILVVLIVVSSASLATVAHAECGGGARYRMGSADFVFEGTVTKTESLDRDEHSTTLTVHRVWKGKVHREITVYHRVGLDGPHFKEGLRVVVFADRQTENDQMTSDRLPTDVPRDAWVSACSTWVADERVRKQLGRSHGPEGP
jgi:hypothetical protein